MPSPEVPANADPVILAVSYPARDEYVELRVSEHLQAELGELLSAAKVDHTPLLFATGGIPGFAVYMASVAGGLGGVAAVLHAFFRRHQDKAVLIERNGTRYELKGMSPNQMSRIIAHTLGDASPEEPHPDLSVGRAGTDDEDEQ